jgi:DNA-binding Lrp family transcriptional regulator
VLITTEPGNLEEVLAEVRNKQGVVEAYAVTGPFDIIAKLQDLHVADALNTVVREIRKINGIRTTETLVVVDLLR